MARHVRNTRSCKYSLDARDDEQKYHSKHAEQPSKINLYYTVASCWSFSQIKLKGYNVFHIIKKTKQFIL
jgi:hypothetical protein